MATKKANTSRTPVTPVKHTGKKFEFTKKRIIWLCIAAAALICLGWYSWWRYDTIYHPNMRTKDEASAYINNLNDKLQFQGTLVYNEITSACSINDRQRASEYDMYLPIITPLTNPVQIGICDFYLYKIYKGSGSAATALIDADKQIIKAGSTPKYSSGMQELLARERERSSGYNTYDNSTTFIQLDFFPYDDPRYTTIEAKDKQLKQWLHNNAQDFPDVTLKENEYLYGVFAPYAYRQPLFFDNWFKH